MKSLQKKDYKFNLRILEVKKISRKRFDLRVYVDPQKKKENVIDIIRLSGVTHYEMTVHQIDKTAQIKKIKRLYGEL